MTQVHVSPRHKAIGVPASAEVQNLFPNAKALEFCGKSMLVLGHGPVETYLLRKLGYSVPAPILTYYEWPHPIGEEPFHAQKMTAALFTTENRAYCLNDKGTGKTRSALWAIDYLLSNNLGTKAIVLAPLSTLNFTWAREVFNTLPNRRCAVLHGTKKKRLEKLADPDVDIFIINHDGVNVLKDELAKRSDIDIMVIDELAVFRNAQAARTKLVRKLAAPMKWVWGMSGSPIPNSPTDSWAQASIITPNTVPKTFGRFRDELMLKVSQFKYIPKDDAVDRAFAALQPAVRYTLDDVKELPECVERYVDVELGKEQARVYKEIAAACFSAVQNDEITAANAGAAMSKLMQVSCGWVYTRDGRTVPLDNSERIDTLIDEINSTSRKCLVFVPFKHALSGISDALTKNKIEHAVVSGDTPAPERGRVFTAFQNTGKYRVIAAHPQCLAHGITLTAADTIIWFAPVTSLEIYDQANARIRRVGQEHKQLVLHLQATPVERRIYSLLAKKQKVQESLLALFKEATILSE